MQNESARLEFWEVQWKLALAQFKLATCQLQQKAAPSLETAALVDKQLGEIAALVAQVQRAAAWSDAAGLAFQERTGMEPADGQAFNAVDAARADEIFATCYPKEN